MIKWNGERGLYLILPEYVLLNFICFCQDFRYIRYCLFCGILKTKPRVILLYSVLVAGILKRFLHASIKFETISLNLTSFRTRRFLTVLLKNFLSKKVLLAWFFYWKCCLSMQIKCIPREMLFEKRKDCQISKISNHNLVSYYQVKKSNTISIFVRDLHKSLLFGCLFIFSFIYLFSCLFIN